jgi:predicted nucleic acid-binding Zn ribbon protein
VKPLSASITTVAGNLMKRGPMTAGKIEAAWRLAVGPAIDRATTVSLRENGTLEVAAAQLSWRRELRRTQGVILGRLRELLGPGPVAKIRVVATLSETASRDTGGASESARRQDG